MKLTLHPDAAVNFTEKAEVLCALVSILPTTAEEPRFRSDTHTAKTLEPDSIIGPIRSSEIDFKGDEVSRSIVLDGKHVGLAGAGYIAFDALTQSIQAAPTLRDTISIKSVKETIFDWLISRYKREPVAPFLEYALPKLEAQISSHQVWVPLFKTYAESSFRVGPVLFEPISKLLMDRWQNAILRDKPEEKETDFLKFFEKERSELQGLLAGTMDFTADPERSTELALLQVERALNLVKFFEPANFHPSVLSHCTILGKQHVQSAKVLRVKNDLLSNIFVGLISKGGIHWQISNDQIAQMKRDGLDRLGEILSVPKPSELESLLVDALQLYSRVGLAKGYSDKLVYLFVTLETLLLKDASESVQQNVGERLAFALETHPGARMRVVKNFKDVYAMRSSFVHHGEVVSAKQITSVVELMTNTWRFIQRVIHNSQRIRTRIQLIETIERIKFS